MRRLKGLLDDRCQKHSIGVTLGSKIPKQSFKTVRYVGPKGVRWASSRSVRDEEFNRLASTRGAKVYERSGYATPEEGKAARTENLKRVRKDQTSWKTTVMRFFGMK